MRVFKTKAFDRLVRADRLPDAALVTAIERAESGLVDAHLGKFLYKLRAPRPGQGRSGGYRMIVVIRSGDFALFVYMFAKNAKANLSDGELEAYRIFAGKVGAFDAAQVRALAEDGTWIEARDDRHTTEPPQPGAGGAARSRKRSS